MSFFGLQIGSERGGEEKSQPLPGIESWLSRVSSLYTTTTTTTTTTNNNNNNVFKLYRTSRLSGCNVSNVASEWLQCIERLV
jgi:hypothetical protein